MRLMRPPREASDHAHGSMSPALPMRRYRERLKKAFDAAQSRARWKFSPHLRSIAGACRGARHEPRPPQRRYVTATPSLSDSLRRPYRVVLTFRLPCRGSKEGLHRTGVCVWVCECVRACVSGGRSPRDCAASMRCSQAALRSEPNRNHSTVIPERWCFWLSRCHHTECRCQRKRQTFARPYTCKSIH